MCVCLDHGQIFLCLLLGVTNYLLMSLLIPKITYKYWVKFLKVYKIQKCCDCMGIRTFYECLWLYFYPVYALPGR